MKNLLVLLLLVSSSNLFAWESPACKELSIAQESADCQLITDLEAELDLRTTMESTESITITRMLDHANMDLIGVRVLGEETRLVRLMNYILIKYRSDPLTIIVDKVEL